MRWLAATLHVFALCDPGPSSWRLIGLQSLAEVLNGGGVWSCWAAPQPRRILLPSFLKHTAGVYHGDPTVQVSPGGPKA